MKYIKKFNESTDNNIIYDILNFLFPIIDEYGLEELKRPSYGILNHITYYGGMNSKIILNIERRYMFEQYVWSIEIENKMKSKFSNDIYNIEDFTLASMLEDCIESCKHLLNAVEVIQGNYDNTFTVLFFEKKPDLKRYKGVDIYGVNAIVKVKDGYLHSNICRHPNCFDYYNDSHQINGLYAIMSYYNGWYYTKDLTIIGKGKYDKKFSDEWHKTVEELKISSRRVQKNYKINVSEFMVKLKEVI